MKVIDIRSKKELDKLVDELKLKEFDIYTVTHERIETKFIQEYMIVAEVMRELERV